MPLKAMEPTAHVRLELSSRPENVWVVRQALAGLGDAVGLSALDLNDIGTAVAEACNNASVHAYATGEGPLEVELSAGSETVGATVRDRGVGLRLDGACAPGFPTDVDGGLAGVGLPSIRALASDARWREIDGGGTAVEMTFSTGLLAWERGDSSVARFAPAEIEPGELGNAIEAEMEPLAVARAVLPRLLRAAAARAHFSIERHADVQRIGSALLAEDPGGWAPSSCVHARLRVGAEALEIAIGPLGGDDAGRLAAAALELEPGLGPCLVRLDTGALRLRLQLRRSTAVGATEVES